MKLLLDTQVALWWLQGDPRLRQPARDLMASHPCLLSIASLWEVAIKHRLGKLPIAPDALRDHMLAAGATLLAIRDIHVIETGRLPPVHEDPFDRLIIAQAKLEGLVAISADAAWSGYGIALERP